MAVPNRLAREGEELVVHRFPTGSLGLASSIELDPSVRRAPAKPKTFWNALVSFFDPPQLDPVCAVCIPPGAVLKVIDLPAAMQRQLNVCADETVTFTQITAAAHSYRDAVRFSNGRVIRLQELSEGLRVRVLDLSFAGELNLDALHAEQAAILPGVHTRS